jgi:uncharacterized protein YjiK
VLTLLSLLPVAACNTGEAPASVDDGFIQWNLPDRLREISGLALTPDQRLLAVTDEQAIVYELDYENGRIVKTFALGEPVVRGDFEGIAVLQDRVWLMTSAGDLYAAEEGADGRSVAFKKYVTGHGDFCELEGLAQLTTSAALLLVCKEAKSKHEQLRAFEWSVGAAGIAFSREVILPEQAIAGQIDGKRVNPSGVAVDPANGEWVMVAARQQALLRMSADGVLSEAYALQPRNRHRQAEGIEVTQDGRMLIADEGGDGKARLAVYRLAAAGSGH